MRATDIAWSFLWGILFFDQYPNYLTMIGGCTMFLSVLLVSIEKIKKAATKNIVTMSKIIQSKTGDINKDEIEETICTIDTTDVWVISVERPKPKTSISNKNRNKTFQSDQFHQYLPLPEEDENGGDDAFTITPNQQNTINHKKK
eukprot:322404_1